MGVLAEGRLGGRKERRGKREERGEGKTTFMTIHLFSFFLRSFADPFYLLLLLFPFPSYVSRVLSLTSSPDLVIPMAWFSRLLRSASILTHTPRSPYASLAMSIHSLHPPALAPLAAHTATPTHSNAAAPPDPESMTATGRKNLLQR